jgi:hypothetical protein
VGLKDVSMPFNPTSDPHVTSCHPGHKDFKLKKLYLCNGKYDRIEHVGANRAPRIVAQNIFKIRPLYLERLIACFSSSDSTAIDYISKKYHPTEKYYNLASHTNVCCTHSKKAVHYNINLFWPIKRKALNTL